MYEQAPSESPVLLTWEPEYADVALAGDLGYTYGISSLKGNNPESGPAESSYMRIWRRGAERKWEVALDIALTIPQK